MPFAAAFGAAAPTSVEFALSSSSFDEGAGTVSFDVSVTNPDASNATTVEVALTGGTATNGTDNVPAYSTTTLTFPAGSSANQTVSITLFDDAQHAFVRGADDASVAGRVVHDAREQCRRVRVRGRSARRRCG